MLKVPPQLGFRPLLNGSLIYFIRQHNLLKNYMPGIPSDLHHRLRKVLSLLAPSDHRYWTL